MDQITHTVAAPEFSYGGGDLIGKGAEDLVLKLRFHGKLTVLT